MRCALQYWDACLGAYQTYSEFQVQLWKYIFRNELLATFVFRLCSFPR